MFILSLGIFWEKECTQLSSQEKHPVGHLILILLSLFIISIKVKDRWLVGSAEAVLKKADSSFVSVSIIFTVSCIGNLYFVSQKCILLAWVCN